MSLRTIGLGLLVSTFSVAVSGCGTKAHPASVPALKKHSHVPLAASAVPKPLALTAMAMKTRMAGWGFDHHHLLVTTDGGHRWTNATPPLVSFSTIGQANYIPNIAWDLVSADDAWLVSTAPSHTYLVSHTTDGGRHWTQKRWRFSYDNNATPESITFANPSDGWIALTPGAAGPQFPMKVWKTTNGGKSWQTVYTTDAEGGQIQFQNAHVGWLVFNLFAAQYTEFQLKRTTNGGRSWTPVSVPPLEGFADIQGINGPDLVFHGSNALFPGSTDLYSARHGYVAVLRTTNGGLDWSLSPKLAATPQTFSGAATEGDTAWAVAAGRLYSTTGGASWTLRSAAPFLVHANGIDLLTPTVGWIWSRGSAGTELWYTASAGRHWDHVTPLSQAP